MEPDSLPTELILSEPRQSLGSVMLDWTPQPGTHVDFEGKTYTVLERRHRYCLKANRYTLHKIALYVKHNPLPDEVTVLGDRIIIGDARCVYNAHSEIMRCAVNPAGPCHNCQHFAPRTQEAPEASGEWP